MDVERRRFARLGDCNKTSFGMVVKSGAAKIGNLVKKSRIGFLGRVFFGMGGYALRACFARAGFIFGDDRRLLVPDAYRAGANAGEVCESVLPDGVCVGNVKV